MNSSFSTVSTVRGLPLTGQLSPVAYLCLYDFSSLQRRCSFELLLGNSFCNFRAVSLTGATDYLTICGDACPLSCVSAEACLTGWPNAQGRRDGKLVNAALLSLMRRVWMYAVLPSSWVHSSAPLVCRHDRVTREAGRVGLVGRDRGRRGHWVALYLYIYTARLLMSVFL